MSSKSTNHGRCRVDGLEGNKRLMSDSKGDAGEGEKVARRFGFLLFDFH